MDIQLLTPTILGLFQSSLLATEWVILLLALNCRHLSTRQLRTRTNMWNLYTLFSGVFEKSVGNLVAIIGDNCATNQSIANTLKNPLLGCASYRFQLAVYGLIAEEQDEVDEVHSYSEASFFNYEGTSQSAQSLESKAK